MFVDNLSKPQFLLSATADAVGIPVATLRSWFQRGHFVMSDAQRMAGRTPATAGQAYSVTLRKVYQIALTVAASRLGISIEKAAKAALAFTDNGDEERQPGEIFRRPDGEWCNTYLIIAPGEEILARVIADDLDTKLRTVFVSGSRKSAAVAVVDVSLVINSVRAKFALPPDDPRFPRGVDPRYAIYDDAKNAALARYGDAKK